MALVAKYRKLDYQLKIDILEGYYKDLGTHLDSLEEYKEEIKEFWTGDENSEQIYTVLSDMIRSVRRAMERTQTTIDMCKRIIEELDSTGNVVSDVIEGALNIVKNLVDL